MDTKNSGLIVTIIVVLVVIAGAWYVFSKGFSGFPGTTATSTNATSTTDGSGAAGGTVPAVSCTGTCSSDMIVLNSPQSGAAVSSPLQISGQARGSWYFEGSFPVELTDAGGNVLTRGTAKAQGAWTTSNFVPFTASLGFDGSAATSNKLFLILRRDNPSGLPQNEGALTVPLTLGAL